MFSHLLDKYLYMFTAVPCVAVFRYLADKYLEQLNMVVEELPPSPQKIGQGKCAGQFATSMKIGQGQCAGQFVTSMKIGQGQCAGQFATSMKIGQGQCAGQFATSMNEP